MTNQQIAETIKEINLIQDDTKHSQKIKDFINSLKEFKLQLFSIAFYLKSAKTNNKNDILDSWFTKHQDKIKTANFSELLKEVNMFL